MPHARNGHTALPSLTALVLLGASAIHAAPEPALAGDGSASPDSAQVAFLTRVSRPTPFKNNCGDPGEVIVDSEVEPHLAVNPSNPRHLLGVYQQDRYTSGGGARSDLAAVSRNGGRSWKVRTVPGISRCTAKDAPYLRVTDPWVDFGPDGTAYLATLSFDTESVDALNWTGLEQVSISANGGFAWARKPSVAEVDELYLEKIHLSADPIRAGTAYLTWEQDIATPEAGVLLDGHVRFARTEDGGRSWTQPVTVPPDLPGFVEAPYGSVHPIPGPGGRTTLVLVLSQMSLPSRDVVNGPFRILATRSEDRGETWGPASVIATSHGLIPTGDVEEPMRTRTCECVPSATATPDGILYVAWYERTPIGGTEGGTDVLFARSDDAGVTWTTGTAASLPHQAFLPVVAVARDGTVGITYYDLRNDKAGDAELTTDVWLAYSSDEGASWRELHVAGPFDLRTAPNVSGYFLGDYHGLVGLPDGFGALFAMARPQAKTGPSDVFYAKITLG